MCSPPAPSRSASVSGRALAALVALAAALVAAFVVAAPTLAASSSGSGFTDERHLTGAFREAFVEYWRSGNRDYSPDLQPVVEYWFRYHVAKAATAATLLIVLIALGVLLWKAFLRAAGLGAGKRAALASAGVLVTMLAVFSLVLVMANVQGAAAPFASLLPMLADGPTDGELADTLEQVRQRLADSPNSGGQTPPALDVMISDFVRYHVAMAVIAAIVAVVLLGASVALWKRFARAGSSDRPTRRVWASFATVSATLSLVLIVIAVANTTTAADPTPALLAFFDGGW
ncbi:MAG: hypothetical protein QOI74_762 [Micromonosporaceae bacterium]|nr:hypothetical protein [Micromonosporaceae bacterium]